MKLDAISGKGNENLYRHPINQNIYFKIFRKGRGECCKSTKTKSIPEARVIADDIRLEFLGVSKIKRGREFCGELFPAWIKRKSINTRPATIASMEFSWAHLKPFISTKLPEEITAKWWESVYVPQKRTETHLARKFFNDRKWLSMFLIQLKRDGILAHVPQLIDVDPPIAPGRVYSDEEIQRLLYNAGSVDLKLQILMAITQGMRIGEIMAMDWDRIDLKNQTMHLRAEDTKIKQERTFGISPSVLEILKSRELQQGPLFASPRDQEQAQGRQGNKRAWTSCKRLAGVSGRFHWLRHTFLTKAFKCSTNPALICEYAGLSLAEAQSTYLHFTVEDTRQVSRLVQPLAN